MSRRVLVIDDEDDIREVAQLSLEMTTGWEISAASSGAEGIAAANRDPPDAILLDVMMPEMDGPTTFRRLRDDPATAHIPVILLTAKAQSSDRARFLDLGVNGVLTKPFDPMTLGSDVAATLGWSL
jgi:two-component system, OmpR family, alkaline phosphatase synthesis response regulator PhoP